MLEILFLGGVVSYTAPEGSDASQGLYDSSYDGHVLNGILKGGLGRLMDGEFGADNFRLDIGYGKGKKDHYVENSQKAHLFKCV